MVARANQLDRPLNLVVTGEVEGWLPALEQIVGPRWLLVRKVDSDGELLDVVRRHDVDAAVLDDEAPWSIDVLQILRMVRRLDQELPVVMLTARSDRRWLESALALTAFSVVAKPLALEELLRQIQRIALRLDRMLRERLP
ncbi:MAG: response regulator [Planctomycetota bacterium]|jgi:two-component system alkaline phosphatase synthesis response regulator PhoP